jgi:hypothetical protein
VNLCDPILVKYFLQEKYLDLKKNKFIIDYFFDIIEEGITFAEGEDWKKKKKNPKIMFSF